MSLVCPECKSLSFQIVDSVECGPESGATENTIQRAFCEDCDVVFFCVYQSTRSFRSDRDDRVTHLAFSTDRDLWNGSADIFEKPTSRISTDVRIALAKSALRMAQETGGSGRHIAYAPASQPQTTTETQGTIATKLVQKLMSRFKK